MRIGSILGLLGVAGLAASAIACTSLLGDFSVSADVCPVGQTFVGGTCVEGTGDGGPAAASCTEPAAPQCGAHGTCEDTSGIAACKCALGYAGPSCSTCSAGYGGAGTCEPICETACPPHGSCVVTNGKGACSCAPGYTAKSSACEWTGGPTDPGFEKPEPGPWDVTGGTVDPAAIGREDGDKGAFIVPAESLCGRPPALGSVAQKVVMPSVTQGEPFAMKVVGRTYCDDVASPTCYGNAGYESALSFPGTFFSAPKVWTEQEICLGEKAYGPDVRVGVGRVRPDPGGHPGLCYQHMAGQKRELQVDSIRIVPSATCPAVGTVANGNFEGDGVWKALGGASVEAGIGDKSSRAGRMRASDGCPLETPTLESSISVPSASLPNAELTFKFKGSPERLLALAVGPENTPGRDLPVTVKGNGTYQSVSMCLPEFAKGYAVPFRLSMLGEATCGVVAERQLVVDELQITSQPSRCAPSLFVPDGGFEKAHDAGGVSFWQFFGNAGSPVRSTAGVSVGASAHGGSRMATLTSYQSCYSADARTAITIPQASGASGPVMKFFYRVRNAAPVTYHADVRVDTDVSVTVALPEPGAVMGQWNEGKLCLPPTAANRAAAANFGLTSPGPAGCGLPVNPAGSIDFDDVSVGVDPACSAK